MNYCYCNTMVCIVSVNYAHGLRRGIIGIIRQVSGERGNAPEITQQQNGSATAAAAEIIHLTGAFSTKY